MVQHVLAVAGAVAQAAQQLYHIRVDAVDAYVHNSLFALALHGELQLAAAFFNGLLNAGRVDTAVADEFFQRHAGNLAAHRVKAGKRDGLGRIVNDKVNPRGCLQRADVAALPADDAAFHFVTGQRHHGYRGFAGMVGGTARHGLADELAGHCVALVLGLRLERGDVHCLFVGELLVQTVEQQLLCVLRRQAGDGFHLVQFAGLDLFDFVQAGLHKLGALGKVSFFLLQNGRFAVHGLFLLVEAALLAAQLRTAFLDFFVGLSLQLKSFVLCFDQRFLALLLCGFHSVVDQALGLFLRAADLCLGSFAAVRNPGEKCNGGSHYACDNGDHSGDDR